MRRKTGKYTETDVGLERKTERERGRKRISYQRYGAQQRVEKCVVIYNKLVLRENVLALIIEQCRNGA